jgi:hypothetical protein
MVRNLKLAVRWLLERTTVGYLALSRHDRRVSGPLGVPEAPWHNAVLKSHDAVAPTLEQVARLKLPAMDDPPKNCDSLAAVDCILKATTPKAHILDTGAETYSGVLSWLCMSMDTEDCRPSTWHSTRR